MTLEKVKEHFKNAKEVKCIFNGKVVDITKNITRDIHEGEFDFWIDISSHDGTGVSLYYKRGNIFADIVSYKEDEILTHNIAVNDAVVVKEN